MTTGLRTLVSVQALRAALSELRTGTRVGFVPTMGALHEGHAALMRAARAECDVVVVSCYVNPTQFGPCEDLERYPRTPETDERIVAASGADLLWLPGESDLYPAGRHIVVRAGPLGDRLEGSARPGHFDGVTTVVAKLLGATQPDALYLGEKDYQQLIVLRAMVRELLLPVEVRGVPIVRDADGLALSTRNAYLTVSQRKAASAIPAALDAAAARAAAGCVVGTELVAAAQAVIDAAPGTELEYLELADPRTLEPVGDVTQPAVLLVAARVGTTRLIDNRTLLPDTAHHQKADHV